MRPEPLRLDRIRVQTARMLEVYSLLRCELENNRLLAPSGEVLERLHRAITTIRANMRVLQEYLLACREDSAAGCEAQEVDGILQAVLRWVREEGK
ncbi:MAG: hypothetical protein AB1505_21270 [Candidatus Latescibacterota bacterium]